MNKKILLFFNNTKSFIEVWKKLGFETIVLKKDVGDFSTPEFQNCLKSMGKIDYIFTFGFSIMIAEVSHIENIKYICWEQDCPVIALWHESATYENVNIFVFDYRQYEELLLRGIKNVWHLPLCTYVEELHECIEKDKGRSKENYGEDVSFVGNLYNDERHSLFDQIKGLPAYMEGYIDGIIEAQRKVWGFDFLENAVKDEIWDILKKYIILNIGTQYEKGVYKIAYRTMIGQKITQLERKEVCSYLAFHYNFALYTGSDTSYEPCICNKGYANYLTQMPLIFHYSKINIHITMRTITSGVPLRVIDVLACEGFLLTNYQPEIAEYFKDGEELVIYQDFHDMYQKIEYYLAHEEERIKIAHTGYLKVKQQFNYTKGISKIINIMEETDG